MGHVTSAVSNQSPLCGQQAGDGQAVEGRQDQAMRQITGSPVQDEDGGLGFGHLNGHRCEGTGQACRGNEQAPASGSAGVPSNELRLAGWGRRRQVALRQYQTSHDSPHQENARRPQKGGGVAVHGGRRDVGRTRHLADQITRSLRLRPTYSRARCRSTLPPVERC